MTQELTFVYDYGQAYLYDAAAEDSVDFLAALDDANATGLTVGVAGELVDLLMPLQWNFDAPLLLDLLELEPPPDVEGWEHAVEFSLRVPSGELRLEGSGGSGRVDVGVPPALYRARWSGRSFPTPGDYVPKGSSPDAYRLQLWPAALEAPPVELKRWPGYDALGE